jgi:flavin reductase (DIM6/NTAB) family NADH-FMN oxidoreductase RutF
MHKTIEPAILYFGTPVVLVSTVNKDGSINVAPISSVWWLGYSCMIGLDGSSKTTQNILRNGECVLNLPNAELVENVNKLAKTTGRKDVPLHKKALGYRYESDKMEVANFTKQASLKVGVPRIKECPVQLEATLSKTVPFGEHNPKMVIPSVAFELNIEQVHVDEALLIHPDKSYVNPDKWHPIIMSFRKYYSTGNYIHSSVLAKGSEKLYAPWKQKGIKARVTKWLLKLNTWGDRKMIKRKSDY